MPVNMIRRSMNILGRAGAMVSVTLRVRLTAAALGTAGLALKAWVDAPHAWQPAGLAVARVVGPLTLALIIVTVPAGLRLADTPQRAFRGAAVGAILALLFFDRPSGILLIFFAALSVAAVAAAAWGLVLVIRNAPLPIESDGGPMRG